MNKITESTIEKFAIELLEKQGFQYIYAPDIAPDSDTPERKFFEDVLLIERLQTAVGRYSSNDLGIQKSGEYGFLTGLAGVPIPLLLRAEIS